MILDLFKLDGRVAIVTGAGRGIGRGIAHAMAEAGADVVCAARTRAEIDQTAAQCEERGARALAVSCDVTRTEQLEELMAATEAELGRIDVLVNNAGGTAPRPALDTTADFMDAALHFECTAALQSTRLAAPRMVKTAGSGSVVNISSRSGQMPMPGFVAYGAGKAALEFTTRVLGQELAPQIRVNAICVGAVRTPAFEVVVADDALHKQVVDGTPMGRIGTVEDVAAGAVYLSSPAADWVTGKIIQIDGGAEAPAIRIPVENFVD